MDSQSLSYALSETGPQKRTAIYSKCFHQPEFLNNT